MLLLRDVVTAIGIGLERHGRHPGGLWMGQGSPMWDCTAEFVALGGVGRCNRDQRPRSPALGRGGPLYHPAHDASAADPLLEWTAPRHRVPELVLSVTKTGAAHEPV